MAADRQKLQEFGITPAIAGALSAAGLVILPRVPTASMLKEAWAEAAAEDAGGVWREMVAQAEREIT